MTFRDFVVAVLRNWPVAVVVTALTLLAGVREVTAAPSYQTQSVITLLSPEAPFPRNAYASFTPSLVLMADVLSQTIETPAARSAVRRAGGHGDFQVSLANRGSEQYPIFDQPYLTLVTSSRSPAEALQTRQAVIAVLSSQLHERQAKSGANARSYITWRISEADSTAVLVTGRPSRQLVATLLLGGIAAVFLSLSADRHRDRLRKLLRALRRRVTDVPHGAPTAGAGSR